MRMMRTKNKNETRSKLIKFKRRPRCACMRLWRANILLMRKFQSSRSHPISRAKSRSEAEKALIVTLTTTSPTLVMTIITVAKNSTFARQSRSRKPSQMLQNRPLRSKRPARWFLALKLRRDVRLLGFVGVSAARSSGKSLKSAWLVRYQAR